MEDRIGWVDYAKGICIILVVMLHAVHNVEYLLNGQGWMHPIVEFAYPFRIPDFFLIAGLFLSRSIHGPVTDYIDRKIVHFIYFYTLWVTLQLGILEFGTLTSSPLYFAKIWLMSFIEPTNSLWFVHMLLVFYVVTWLVRNVPVWIVLLGALILQSLYQLVIIDTGWNVLDRFCNRYVYFYIGYAFAPQIFAFAKRAAKYPLLGLGGLLIWAVLNWWMVQHEMHYMFLTSFVMGIAGATAVCVVSALLSRFRWASFLRYCGRNSIVIYLTYAFPLAFMLRFVSPRTGAPFGDVGLATALTLAFCVGLPLLFHACVRHTSMRILYERPQWASLTHHLRRRALRADGAL